MFPIIAVLLLAGGTALLPVHSAKYASEDSNVSDHACDVAVSDTGYTVVVWEGYRDQTPPSKSQIYAKIFFTSESSTLLNVAGPTDNIAYRNPRVAMRDNGGFVVVWEQAGPGVSDYAKVYFQRYNEYGVPMGGATLVPVEGVDTNDITNPDVAMFGNGDFYVAWTYYFNTSDTDIRYRIFRYSDGTPFTGDLALAETGTPESDAAVAVDVVANLPTDTSVAIAYRAYDNNTSTYAINVQRLSAGGTKLGSPITIQGPGLSYGPPSIGMDQSGNFAVGYEELTQDRTTCSHYQSNGFWDGDDFLFGVTTPSISLDRDGTVVACTTKYEQVRLTEIRPSRDYSSRAIPVFSTGSYEVMPSVSVARNGLRASVATLVRTTSSSPIPPTVRVRFYKRAAQGPDSDGDGFGDAFESYFGSDPGNPSRIPLELDEDLDNHVNMKDAIIKYRRY
ncbi:hypothetical protein KQI84_14740 [bacterium]|nr:hypothetical protein [bacterium]